MKDGLVGDKICNSPWLVNQLTTFEKVYTATGQKQCWFCLFWRLQYHNIFWGRCFIASVSPRSYQTWFSTQISCQLTTFLNDRLVASAQHFPFLHQLQHRSDIGYKYWKRSTLRNITSLACETKPTLCKLSKTDTACFKQAIDATKVTNKF